MDRTSWQAMPSLGFWAKHVEALDWLHENYYGEENRPPHPASMKELFASEGALTTSLELIDAAISEQNDFLTSLKISVFEHISKSSVVGTKASRVKRADGDFAVEFVAKRGKKKFSGALCAYIHTNGDPASLKLTTTLWIPSAKRQEHALAEIVSTLTETNVQVTRSKIAGWGYGSVLLCSRMLSEYWIGDTSTLDGHRLMSDALATFSKIDDRIWEALYATYAA